jgi:hypothetical protein
MSLVKLDKRNAVINLGLKRRPKFASISLIVARFTSTDVERETQGCNQNWILDGVESRSSSIAAYLKSLALLEVF